MSRVLTPVTLCEQWAASYSKFIPSAISFLWGRLTTQIKGIVAYVKTL